MYPISRTDRLLRPSDGKPCLRRVAETPRLCPGLSRVRVATTPPTIGLVVNDDEPSASSLDTTYIARSLQHLMAHVSKHLHCETHMRGRIW
jgi:hypothetical protein